jgi:hypothetical protein
MAIRHRSILRPVRRSPGVIVVQAPPTARA